jgi:hypothetical protein
VADSALSVEEGGIDKGGSSRFDNAVGRMNVAERMYAQYYSTNGFQQFWMARTLALSQRRVLDAQWRTVSDQNMGVLGDVLAKSPLLTLRSDSRSHLDLWYGRPEAVLMIHLCTRPERIELCLEMSGIQSLVVAPG